MCMYECMLCDPYHCMLLITLWRKFFVDFVMVNIVYQCTCCNKIINKPPTPVWLCECGKPLYVHYEWEGIIRDILIDEKMGLNDLQGHFNSHGTPDLEELTIHISTQITQYEPRLKDISVSLDEEHKSLSSFSWRLVSMTHDELDVFASIIINADGRVSIKSAV